MKPRPRLCVLHVTILAKDLLVVLCRQAPTLPFVIHLCCAIIRCVSACVGTVCSPLIIVVLLRQYQRVVVDALDNFGAGRAASVTTKFPYWHLELLSSLYPARQGLQQ